MALKIFTLLATSLLMILLFQAPQADAGPAACIACLLAHAGEAAGACAITAGGYLLCLLAAVGIKGALFCAIPCAAFTP